jgi:hypothetical protein
MDMRAGPAGLDVADASLGIGRTSCRTPAVVLHRLSQPCRSASLPMQRNLLSFIQHQDPKWYNPSPCADAFISQPHRLK